MFETIRRGRAILIVAAFVQGWAFLAPSEVVYDDSSHYLKQFYVSSLEYGDEIQLRGEARRMTAFQFEYYGGFIPSGREKARLRIYANDGPGLPPKPDVSHIPQTLLYDSGARSISPGFNLFSVDDLSIAVSNTVTWSVQFEGLSQVPGDEAGLVLYAPLSVGFSYNDYWLHTAGGWQLYHFTLPGMIADFGCRLVVSPDSPLRLVRKAGASADSVHLEVRGPVGRMASIEQSADLSHWKPVAAVSLFGDPVELTLPSPAGQDALFFRGVLEPQTPTRFVGTPHQTNGLIHVTFSGPNLQAFQLQSTTNFVSWTVVKNGVLPEGRDVEDLPMATAGFFRLELIDQSFVNLKSTSRYENGRFILNIDGVPLRRCRVEASSDIVHWRPVATNILSFTSGSWTYVEPASNGVSQQFYRAELLPSHP